MPSVELTQSPVYPFFSRGFGSLHRRVIPRPVKENFWLSDTDLSDEQS